MSRAKAITGDHAAESVLELRYVQGPNRPRVFTRPNKINARTIEGLMEPGEQLIIWGTLPRSFYFLLNESLLRKIFLGLTALSFMYSMMAVESTYLLREMPWIYACNLPLLLLGVFLAWTTWTHFQKASFVLTDRRILRIGQFTHQFDLSAFSRAEQHINDDGTAVIQLFMEQSVAPDVVLVTAAGAGDAKDLIAIPIVSASGELPAAET